MGTGRRPLAPGPNWGPATGPRTGCRQPLRGSQPGRGWAGKAPRSGNPHPPHPHPAYPTRSRSPFGNTVYVPAMIALMPITKSIFCCHIRSDPISPSPPTYQIAT